MNDFYLRMSAATLFAMGLQCHAAGLSVATEDLINESPIYLPPIGCRFQEVSIPDSARPPRQPVAQKPAPPPFSAVADVPMGPMRTVRFSYHFSGLQDILPTYSVGNFKISSTQVTVFKGPWTTYPTASLRTFRDQKGKVDMAVSLTGSAGERRPFQKTWLIRVTSMGELHDEDKSVRPATVTLLCDMQVNGTPKPVPTLSQ